jgi:hypothetical protein
MNEDIKKELRDLIVLNELKIIDNYNKTALLLNACDVSKKRYKNMKEDIALSTTQNIPSIFRLNLEIDTQFSKVELIDKYENELVESICENYIVSSISIVDGVLEDMYEILLKYENAQYSATQLDNQVRQAWANDNIIKFFDNKFDKPEKYEIELYEAFLRYKELRIIRHSLVHSNGVITSKNLKKLEEYFNSTPEERRKYSIFNSKLYDEKNKLTLDITVLLSIRMYIFNFSSFLLNIIE